MSAWICSEKHIKLLVAYHVFYDKYSTVEITEEKLQEANDMAQELWRENHRSINYRYNERNRTPKISLSYQDVYSAIKTPAEHVIKLAHSYDYQTCEHPNYPKSKAYKLIREIVYSATCYTEAWDDGPWSI